MKHKSLNFENNIEEMAQEILKIISKDKIEQIAKDVGFVKRKGKINAWQFLYLWGKMSKSVLKGKVKHEKV